MPFGTYCGAETYKWHFLKKIQIPLAAVLLLSALSFSPDPADRSFFLAQKRSVDSLVSGFQPSEKLYYDHYRYYASYDTSHFIDNRYYVGSFKTEYGDIFSDTLNGLIRYMLVQGDCEIWQYYTKGGQPFKVDHLKMFGGTMSWYLIGSNKLYIVDDNKNQSWCTSDTSSYRAELCLDGKKTVYYQRQGHDFPDSTRYLHPDVSQKKQRQQFLEDMEKIKKSK